MPVNTARLRAWILSAAVLLIAVVLIFYSYARYRVQRALDQIPKKLGVEVQQSANSFSFSKSQGGRTLFTIRAAKAIQYKTGIHTQLHDVDITVYGRFGNRYDRIYGSDFDYDPSTGDIAALGEVQIDLRANAEGPLRPDQAKPDGLKNPLHLRTRALIFSQKDGMARTAETVEFAAAQGHGSAQGAVFDSNAGTLTLVSNVSFYDDATARKRPGAPAMQLNAGGAVLYQRDNRIEFRQLDLKQGDREIQTDNATVALRQDASIERILASGNIKIFAAGQTGNTVHAQEATVELLPGNHVKTGLLSGGVTADLRRQGEPPAHGRADRVELSFGGGARLESIRARGDVDVFEAQPGSAQAPARELKADGLDATVLAGNRIGNLTTFGTARLLLASAPGRMNGKQSAPATTVVTAGAFTARFGEKNRIEAVHGESLAKIVSSAQGQLDRVSTSDKLDVGFGPSSPGQNRGIMNEAQIIQQDGNFHYKDGEREAKADHARYVVASDLLTLSGTPWLFQNGLTATAREIVVNNAVNQTRATDDVKVSYVAPGKSGAAPAASPDPIHITSASMVANSPTQTATFTGGVRLWQSSSVIQAPVIEFSAGTKNVLAHGDADHNVLCSFSERQVSESPQPITISSQNLDYLDAQRKAHFTGKVIAKQSDGTMEADLMDVELKPRDSSASSSLPPQSSQIDRIAATGHVQIAQPGRKATAEKLTYLADSGKYTLTGSPGNPPSIFDAERGSVSGDSLTFDSRAGRFVVDSNGLSRTITQTQGRQ